jgi:hypothetical protein
MKIEGRSSVSEIVTVREISRNIFKGKGEMTVVT